MTQSAAPGRAQELGRISRPGADQYRGRRKLILLPLLYSPATGEPEGAAALQNYWQQAQTQVAALENALGGLEQLRAGDLRSHSLVSLKCDPRPSTGSGGSGGAVLEATEDLTGI